jgi:hypothetical protein
MQARYEPTGMAGSPGQPPPTIVGSGEEGIQRHMTSWRMIITGQGAGAGTPACLCQGHRDGDDDAGCGPSHLHPDDLVHPRAREGWSSSLLWTLLLTAVMVVLVGAGFALLDRAGVINTIG